MTMPEGRVKRITANLRAGATRRLVVLDRDKSEADEVWIYNTDGQVIAKVFPSGLVETRAEIVLVTHSRNATPEGATP